jgi:hypothetical protein
MATNRAVTGTAWAGWVVFASVMLIMVGTINVFEGLVALFNDERLVLVANRLIAVDLTGWAWTILLFGAVMILTGFGLLSGQKWARITSIIVVGLHAVSQIAWLGAYPVWSLLMIALDTVILFALTARWSDATAADRF